jgi:NAD(P)-dependent dehydrogenase (short-subunit alcohol dehydrogenase family)
VVQPLQLDVASAGSIKEAVGQLCASYDQRLDCLVNNAGVNTVSWSQRAWDAERAVNFEGPVLLAEAVVSLLRPGTTSDRVGQFGDIINMRTVIGCFT